MSKLPLQKNRAVPRVGIATLIVDDSPRWVKSLLTFLALHPVIRVVGVAGDGLEGLAAVESLRPELVLLDIQMPRLGGLETARIILERFPEVVVILMAANHNPDLEMRPSASGAHAFLAKSEVRRALLPVIRAHFPKAQP